MGKKSDKLYITSTEWSSDFGGAKRAPIGSEFKRLPFSCCALSLQPFENPMCTPDGTIFDLINIIPWLRKHGTNPVTGQPLAPSALFKLTFSKNDDGQYQCPITYKVFNEHTHIVAIKTSGNVYEYAAVEQLNIKTKNWTDLITGESFTRKDIVTIQDPHNVAARNINQFHYLVNDLRVVDDAAEAAKSQVSHRINAVGSTSRILDEMAAKDKLKQEAESKKKASAAVTPSFVAKEKKAYNVASFSTGAAAASFTSTGISPVVKNEAAVWNDDEVAISHVKNQGAAVIQTNLGDIHLELFCTDTPRTCLNFVRLAKTGYYRGVLFHRLIAGFMVQGGDPTGTGRGGQSIWGVPFEDEFKPNLKHDVRGVLSMANRGKATNTSQFFITLGPCKHLDGKHSVFGKVVGAHEVLSAIEQVAVDTNSKPLREIKMLDVVITTDPFEDALNEIATKDTRAADEASKRAAERTRKERLAAATRTTSQASDKVGKYLAQALGKRKAEISESNDTTEDILAEIDAVDDGADRKSTPTAHAPKKKAVSGGFGNFSNW
eukprot:jgi/Hompol1/4893/HPOL_001036-RA